MALKEYEPGTAFPGVIGRTTDESSPAWPRPLRAEAGSPNVLFIVLDDTGFGQLGCYGSPIATPNLDALAAGGLLYTNMHTTALCSPSRSCIITGRNHHANATAAINELATGYPGYNGRSRSRTGSCRRCCWRTATAPTWSASTTCCRRSSSPAPGRSTGGRWGAGSSGSTGSSAVTPASGIRTWSMTTTRSSRRAPRSRGIT